MNDCRIPLVIGVTGHRDLRPDDRDLLTSTVRAFFTELKAQYPATPLLVLSPLAEGADRLVAQLALAEFGVELVVPLPLPRAEYEKDFGTPESRAEFAGLLRQARRVIEIGLVTGATPASIAVPGLHRDRQYGAVGAWIARYSQIMIALWDGNDSLLPGGTGAIVDFKLGRRPDLRTLDGVELNAPECGPVFHVHTPRRRDASQVHVPISGANIYPPCWGTGKNAKREWTNVLKRIERFNAEVRAPGARLEKDIARSRAWESGPDPAGDSPLLDNYAAADALAIRYQSRRHGSLRALFLMALTAVITFIFYDDIFREAAWAPFLLYTYLGIFAGAYLLYFFGRRCRYEANHLEYRALAEGLRVQIQWLRAGVDAQVADHYLRKQRTDLDWIRAAIRNCRLRLEDSPGGKSSDTLAPIRSVADGWVNRQRSYFAKALIRNERRERLFDRSSGVLVFAALVASLVLAIVHRDIAAYRWLHNGFTVGISLVLALAGALKGYASKIALPEESKQYRRMEGFFRRAGDHIAPALEAGRVDDARVVLLEVGKESLRENGDWLLLHRARPMEVPAG